MSEPRGPIEDRVWPEKIAARVVEPGANPRLHGYDVRSDLAHHYGFVDVVLLALTGELDPARARAFEIALTFASPASVREAPGHAAMLARLCGARPAGVVSVAATGLAEQSRSILAEHEVILARLATGSLNGLAERFAARDEGERAAVVDLRAALGPLCALVPALGYDLRLDTALLAVFVACGLRDPERLELALTFARLPAACAEAFATPVGAFTSYPMNMPPFVYRPAGGASR